MLTAVGDGLWVCYSVLVGFAAVGYEVVHLLYVDLFGVFVGLL